MAAAVVVGESIFSLHYHSILYKKKKNRNLYLDDVDVEIIVYFIKQTDKKKNHIIIFF